MKLFQMMLITSIAAQGEGSDAISHAAECSDCFRLSEIQKSKFYACFSSSTSTMLNVVRIGLYV